MNDVYGQSIITSVRINAPKTKHENQLEVK